MAALAAASRRRSAASCRLRRWSAKATAEPGQSADELIERGQGLLKDLLPLLQDKRLKGEVESLACKGVNHGVRIFMLGEFSAGKSTLINALVGKEACETGVKPTTMGFKEVAGSSGIVYVDSMGINAAGFAEHKTQTMEEVKNADIVFLVLRANQPFTECEEEMCKELNEHKPEIAVVVTYWDTLRKPVKQQNCRQRVRDCLRDFLPFTSSVPTFYIDAETAAEMDGESDFSGNQDFQDLVAFIKQKYEDQEYQALQRFLSQLARLRSIAKKGKGDLKQIELQTEGEMKNKLNMLLEDEQHEQSRHEDSAARNKQAWEYAREVVARHIEETRKLLQREDEIVAMQRQLVVDAYEKCRGDIDTVSEAAKGGTAGAAAGAKLGGPAGFFWGGVVGWLAGALSGYSDKKFAREWLWKKDSEHKAAQVRGSDVEQAQHQELKQLQRRVKESFDKLEEEDSRHQSRVDRLRRDQAAFEQHAQKKLAEARAGMEMLDKWTGDAERLGGACRRFIAERFDAAEAWPGVA